MGDISKEQIAHDLAIAKLCGSNAETEQLIKLYRQYKDEVLSALRSEPNPPPRHAEILNPF